MQEVYRIAADWIRAGVPFAAAQLVAVRGSSPRELGATMIVDGGGRVFGNVSGGCVESALVVECERAISSGEASTHRFGISDDDVFAIGLTCGGVIDVLVTPMLPGSDAACEMLRELEEREAERESPRLIVVGAVEYAAALARLGGAMGYATTVVDPRPVFTTPERFPGAEVVAEWPDEYLSEALIDARTAICVLTHDSRFDVPALQVALASSAGYVGAMGSRRTHEDRLRRLTEAGVSAVDIARLRSPIGLDLGGRTPEDTALSILAEIVAVRNGAMGMPLSERSGPVHAAGVSDVASGVVHLVR
ncbi:MAG: XdhC family protein [Ancrocorticia sp.]